MSFKDCISKQVVLLNILGKNFIFFTIMLLWLTPPGDSMDIGQGYDDMIGYATCSLSQRLMQ